MTAATYNKSKFIVAMLVALLMVVVCVASCTDDSADASSLADNSVVASSEADESLASDDSTLISSDFVGDSETSRATSSTEESSNDSSPPVDVSDETSEVSEDVSEDVSDDFSDAPHDNQSSEPSDENSEPSNDSSTPSESSCSHFWRETTCIAPRTCQKCGATVGSAAPGAHHYRDDICVDCGYERPITFGDSPVYVVLNGVEHALHSYEEACEVVTYDLLENAENGYTVIGKARGVVMDFVSNGDGTYYSPTDSRTYPAYIVCDVFLCQWCRDCGHRTGNGQNGTCVRFLRDAECSKCGEWCEKLTCHTCDE